MRQFYYKLQQWVITSYGSFITDYGKNTLQITTNSYYKLRQLLFLKNSKLLQIIRQVLLHITAVFSVITNYGNFYYKLRQVLQITTLLQITS